MLASQVIAQLKALIEREQKDLPVKLDTNPVALVGIDYIDLDCEEDIIVISAQSLGENTETEGTEGGNGQ